MEQNRFFNVMDKHSSYSNINGIEDVKEKKMSFKKLNNNPGIGHIQLTDNNIIKKYMFSDHPILNKIREGKRKTGTLKKRLQHFLTRHKRKKKTNKKKKTNSKKKTNKKKKTNSKKKTTKNKENSKKKKTNSKKKKTNSKKKK